MITYTAYMQTSAGILQIKTNEEFVTNTSFVDVLGEDSYNKPRILSEAQKQLEEYFSGRRKVFDLALFFQGTSFQENIWRTLLKIPYGKTVSYAEEAGLAGCERAVRAVANANGKNPIAIIIPCHRIIRSDGSIGGYSGGVWHKEKLLLHEKNNY